MTAGKRRWVLPVGVAAAIALLACGAWAASVFQSPAQREAAATPPTPEPVLARVQTGVLAEERMFTGTVGPSDEVALTILAADGAVRSVVTARPVRSGEAVTAGSLLTEVNGSPVFLAQSAFAFYRDIGHGDTGPDVHALQATLAQRGLAVTVDGQYGDETAAAVDAWFADAGYRAPRRDAPRAAAPPPRNEGTGSGESPPSTPEPAAPSHPFVPVTAIVQMPFASAAVLKGLDIGDVVAAGDQGDVTLGASDTVIRVTASSLQLGPVADGDACEFEFDGTRRQGTVADLGPASPPPDGDDSSGSAGSAGSAPSGQADELTFTVIPSEPLADTGGARDVRVVVTKPLVEGESLLVPATAVTDRAAGGYVVTKRAADGTFVEIPVRLLASLTGQAAIEPEQEDDLRESDEVRVG